MGCGADEAGGEEEGLGVWVGGFRVGVFVCFGGDDLLGEGEGLLVFLGVVEGVEEDGACGCVEWVVGVCF